MTWWNQYEIHFSSNWMLHYAMSFIANQKGQWRWNIWNILRHKHIFALTSGNPRSSAPPNHKRTLFDMHASYYWRCLFLDFSSALYAINISHLLPKLQHLDCNVIGWLTSYLSGQFKEHNLMSLHLQSPIQALLTGLCVKPCFFLCLHHWLNNIKVCYY